MRESGISVSNGQCTSGVKGILLSVHIRQRELFVGGVVVVVFQLNFEKSVINTAVTTAHLCI